MNTFCHWPGCREEVHSFTNKLCDVHRRQKARMRAGNDSSNKTRGRWNPLTTEEMAEIKRRLARFESPRTIAVSMGITKSAIHHALAREKKAREQ